MENYAEMLQALADTFGTTVEHLWGVLIKQAAISATVDTVMVIALASMITWGFRLVQKKTKEPTQVEGEYHKYAEWREEAAFIAWIVWGFISLLAVLCVFDMTQGVVAGFANPEYWALMKIKG